MGLQLELPEENIVKSNRPHLFQTGFSMLEVLVSLLILPIGLLGLASLQMNALKRSSDAANQSLASWLAYDVAERMQSNPEGSTQFYLRDKTSAECSSAPAKFCAQVFYAGQVQTSESCSNQEQAAFDLWDIFCNRSTDEINESTADMLGMESYSIQCSDINTIDSDACTTGSTIDIEISLNGRATTNKIALPRDIDFIISL